MEIRLLTQEDLHAYQHIASRAFARGEPVQIEPERFLTAERTRLGAFEDDRLQAQYSILDFELFFGQTKRPCGGIAGVACEPSARGRGYAGALIDRSLELMRDRGQYLSILWPFDQRFYQRYGWDWTGHDRSYTVPLSLLEIDPEAEHIEPIVTDQVAALAPIYEEKARQYHGAVVRTSSRWDALLKPQENRHVAAYVYRRDGKSEGYALIRFEKKADTARAVELVVHSPRAYRAFLTLFKRHAATVERFRWHAPMDDYLWNIVCNWDVKTRLIMAGMGRVVDAQAALRALKLDPETGGEALLRVMDPHAPWNESVWRIASEGGNTTVEKSARMPEVTMDAGALSQAYWGSPSLRDLRRAGRMDVESERGYDFLAALLPSTPVWLADDF